MSNDFHMPNLQQNIISDDSPLPVRVEGFRTVTGPTATPKAYSIMKHHGDAPCAVPGKVRMNRNPDNTQN